MKGRFASQQSLKQAIENWLEGHPVARRAKETRVINVWGRLLGRSVKNRTVKAHFSNGRLYVKLDSSVLRSELSYSKADIIRKMNLELGSEMVTDLILS